MVARLGAGDSSAWREVMDSLVAAAGRALAVGDALGALKRVALREDPPALALRGIAMAQLGDHARARELLRRAARGFGAHEALARARCVVAEAEVALAMRDFSGTPRTLAAAAHTLQARGDRGNALQARLIAVRRLLLLGRLEEAASSLDAAEVSDAMPAALQALAGLAKAELALRSLRTDPARQALSRAGEAAARSGVEALRAEVAGMLDLLDRPAARLVDGGRERLVLLQEAEALDRSGALVIDACRHGVRAGQAWLPLARRPVLFALLRELARAWPGDVDRHVLIEQAFRTRHADETHRARLRVEIARLRRLVEPFACVESTACGFVLVPSAGRRACLLLPPIDGDQASLVALLGDGAAWSTSALALAMGDSQRTVQRALAGLEAEGRVRSVGRGRSQRWLAPTLAGFATILLLPAALPAG